MSYTLRPPMRCTIRDGVLILTEFPVPFEKNKKYCLVQCVGEIAAVVSLPSSLVEECPANWIIV